MPLARRVTVSAPPRRTTLAPMSERMSVSIAPGCVECAGHPVTDDRAAGDHRGREERRGVGEVGLDRDVLAADRPGRHDPLARRPGARRARRGARATRRSCRCAGCSAAARPRGRGAGRRRSGAPRAAAPRRTGSTRSRRSTTSPPRTWPCPRTMKGSAQWPPSSMSTPTSRSAVIIAPIGRCSALSCAVRVTSPLAKPPSGGDEPHDGAGLAAVDLGAAARAATRASRRCRRRTRRCPARARCRRRAPQRLDHARRVVGVQRREQAARAVGERGEDQLAIGQRFGARHRDGGVRAGRARPARAMGRARPARRLGNTRRQSSGSTLLNPVVDNPRRGAG